MSFFQVINVFILYSFAAWLVLVIKKIILIEMAADKACLKH